eukprot:INCI15720.3.p1 GENE.INCI15720.3~~INCI15720.3.p1  ORF type:complete len:438 (-),score=73.78 INCI15720.3:79-1392(-)
MASSPSSQEKLFRQQDRKRLQERQRLEQTTLPDLKKLAKRKGIPLPDEDVGRFVVIDLLLKHSEVEVRRAQEAQRLAQRKLREAQKQHEIQLAEQRDRRLRNKDTGLTKEVAEALGKRIERAKRTRFLDLANSQDGQQSLFKLEQVPGAVLSNFKLTKRGDLATGLRELWLTNNLLESVSPELRQIKGLEVLCLSGNRLKKIPAFFGALKRLKKLFLARNEIDGVPVQLQNLRRLQELHLDYNKLATLDLALTELRSLRRLSLTHNRIQQVPAEIRRLQDLVELNLDHNRIGPSLPRNMSRLASSLQILGVSYNFLAEFPPCLHDLDLVVLRLEGNRATDYVVSNSESGLITHGTSIPRRECDGFLQTRTHGGKLLPGYMVEAEAYTEESCRWFDDSELEDLHQLLRTRAAAAKQQRIMDQRRASLSKKGKKSGKKN